ncbi:hypothetical protein OK006_11151 [Actinobacteria bacterium OK006]|nr:hypothetical protein OK006_11151 [Actinobacteria bacterium OK006]
MGHQRPRCRYSSLPRLPPHRGGVASVNTGVQPGRSASSHSREHAGVRLGAAERTANGTAFVHDAARAARPLPDVQGLGTVPESAGRADLRRRESTVHPGERAAAPDRLVLQHPDERRRWPATGSPPRDRPPAAAPGTGPKPAPAPAPRGGTAPGTAHPRPARHARPSPPPARPAPPPRRTPCPSHPHPAPQPPVNARPGPDPKHDEQQPATRTTTPAKSEMCARCEP